MCGDSNKLVVSYDTCLLQAEIIATKILNNPASERIYLYPVPRGGYHAAALVAGVLRGRSPNTAVAITSTLALADYVIDDIIDSGKTKREFEAKCSVPFYALVDKINEPERWKGWVIFPWEESAAGSIQDNVRRLLQYVGENPERGGLIETPKRVAAAWEFWTKGYNENPAEILKTFEDGGENYNQMVIVKDIEFSSKCEHHLADIFGTATIAYIPNRRIVGLSKLSRVLDCFARRLQVQERLTNQVADAIDEHLCPQGVGVLIKARHRCMESRGICKTGSITVTSALRGAFLMNQTTREEFFNLANMP